MDTNKLDIERFNQLVDAIAEALPGSVRELFTQLLDQFETLLQQHAELEQKYQAAQAEIARLKHLKPPPKRDSKPSGKKGKKDSLDKKDKKHQRERGKKADKQPRKKRIRIDRHEKVFLDPDSLPGDFRPNGYRKVTVQNIYIVSDNVCYHLQRGYSPSTGEFYEASLPGGVKAGYGVELEATVLMFYYQLRVTEPKIHQLLTAKGIVISKAEVHRIITDKHLDLFTEERRQILDAGLAATTYQQIDDTGINVSGKKCHVNALCSPYYTIFVTTAHKDTATIDELIVEALGDPDATLENRVSILIADDASQFHGPTEFRGLCWLHEERLFAELQPRLDKHVEQLDRIRDEIWNYYRRLKQYKEDPTEEEQERLDSDFDKLFGQTTGYDALDRRLVLTLAKKPYLLLVLDFPFIPIENNESERAVREWVVKRRISHGTRSSVGSEAWDVHLSIVETAKKQGQDYYEYVVDCLSGRFLIPSLARQILASAGVEEPRQLAAVG